MMRMFAIAAVVCMATMPLAYAASEANGVGHGEADGRQDIGQMPAMRWDDALRRVYSAQFRVDETRVVVAQLPPSDWDAASRASYGVVFSGQVIH